MMKNTGKVCRGCGKTKDFEDFAFRGLGANKSRRSDFCMECENETAKKKKVCLRCGQAKCLLNFRRHKRTSDGFTGVCLECQAQVKKATEGGKERLAITEIYKREAKRKLAEKHKEQEEALEEYERRRPVICACCGFEKPHEKFLKLERKGPFDNKYSRLCDECQELNKDRPKGMTYEAWAEKLKKQKAQEKEQRMARRLKRAEELGISYGAMVAREYREARAHG